jgi:transposase
LGSIWGSIHFTFMVRTGSAEPFRKQVSRKQLVEFFATFHACTVVMEACAGAHHMARKLAAFGHQVKLISPQFVRPFVKSNKSDFVDAEAICEAASRPAMRFVTPKTESQQTLSALHRVRESLVRDRVKSVDQMHGFLLEFGISLPVGRASRACQPCLPSIHCRHSSLRSLSVCTPTSSISANRSARSTRRWRASSRTTISASA